jgi:hypothetical protein
MTSVSQAAVGKAAVGSDFRCDWLGFSSQKLSIREKKSKIAESYKISLQEETDLLLTFKKELLKL